MILRSRFRPRLWFALAGFLAGSGVIAAQAAPTATPARPVVVELYTSQGCSSCPPADAFLGRLADRAGVLALSLPITYWDMLGWKDTLASKADTDRQKAYAAAMGRGGIYTPQMIVDGLNDLVGSREAAIEKAIAARQADMQDVPVTLTLARDQLHIAVAGSDAKPEGEATIWLFAVEPKATVKIGGGENDGRTITYRNVVRAIKAVGMWKGAPVSIDLSRSETGAGRGDGVAVLVQTKGYGRIVGAADAGLAAH